MILFFNDTATTEIYTLSLHDALPILARSGQPFGLDTQAADVRAHWRHGRRAHGGPSRTRRRRPELGLPVQDRKSTRLNSSHAKISYAVFCLKKNKIHKPNYMVDNRIK